jgi:hypothetical protein
MPDTKPAESRSCKCPYCEEEIKAFFAPICQACGVTLVYCPTCNAPLDSETSVCSQCGQEAK